ncbi:E3 ubiquitin-protein ligase RNF182 [Eublepharis macularius]|uniref:E3 ubiquitin-protein ligase RNF182 n=1 Tax=Eublepharis macularius TaxID=481883 RepID=A0AA97L2V3_EUBMA|nr:E3 ubiquitin-protein ligase RNF182 [Eublepharis macularius]
MALQEEQPGGGGGLKEGAGPAEEEPAKEEEEAAAEEGEGGPAAGGWEAHECRICYNRFDLERRAPKLLECLHTFCQDCLAQLHLRAVLAAHSSGRGGPAADAAIACPLCRHPTALPDCRVHSLPVNTKLLERLPLRAAAAAWPELTAGQRRALLQPSRQSLQRSPSERGSQGAIPAAVEVRHVLARQWPAGLGGGCSCSEGDPSWRRKALNLGCLCAVFCILSMLLLFFAWMNWLTGSIFIGVAVLLLFFSTMPFAMYGFRNRSEPGAPGASPAPTAANGAAPGSATPQSRQAADERNRW